MLSLNRSLQVTLAAMMMVACSSLVVGCGPEKHEAIPATASVQTQGTQNLTFTAPHDGMAYVEDTNEHKLVWSGQVLRGQKITLDATREKDQIMLDGQTVVDKTLRPGHEYKIYFDDRSDTMRTHSSSSDRM
jgi:hypothetical protein